MRLEKTRDLQGDDLVSFCLNDTYTLESSIYANRPTSSILF